MKLEISSVHEAHALKLKFHKQTEIRYNSVPPCPPICLIVSGHTSKILCRFAPHYRCQGQLVMARDRDFWMYTPLQFELLSVEVVCYSRIV